MSYNKRINFKNRSVTRPRTYREIVNDDGTKTFIPEPGTVVEEGTPQSAENFNNMDEALQHISVAFDLMYTIMQAELRDAQDRIEALESQNNGEGE